MGRGCGRRPRTDSSSPSSSSSSEHSSGSAGNVSRPQESFDDIHRLVASISEDESLIDDIKRAVRPTQDLDVWTERGFVDLPLEETFGTARCDLQVIHVDDLTVEEFRDRFERTSTPCIIRGCTREWAARNWTFEDFYARFGRDEWAVGEGVRLPLDKYLKYGTTTSDDSPLYVFEAHLAERFPELVGEFQTPKFFQDNVMEYIHEYDRPFYEWVLFGPPRSGSKPHFDPNGTHAWLTVLRGRKRWTLFPPNVRERDLLITKDASTWLIDSYPRLRERSDELGMLEVVQQPGDTIFVPANWWHCVFNYDFTMAVTRNYVNESNMRLSMATLMRKEALTALTWYDALPRQFKRLCYDVAKQRASASELQSSGSGPGGWVGHGSASLSPLPIPHASAWTSSYEMPSCAAADGSSSYGDTRQRRPRRKQSARRRRGKHKTKTKRGKKSKGSRGSRRKSKGSRGRRRKSKRKAKSDSHRRVGKNKAKRKASAEAKAKDGFSSSDVPSSSASSS